ncbi:hypothetical protein CEP54_016334 [Fusarium duplospermum]|uniref:Uncharacterized protein n=1 Tax=Fusarium duplospermum TaxID=1325734 RepID=A0A428NF31_9HYPO|nr:hypothetical protein CEP54_016334 [Fusarium duplospermum]
MSERVEERSNENAIDTIVATVFKQGSTWPQDMAERGYTVLFFGNDINRFKPGKKILKDDEVYLALRVGCGHTSQVEQPSWNELQEHLNDYTWYNESKGDIQLEDSGVVLNISDCFGAVSSVDISRLTSEKEGASIESKGNPGPNVVAYGEEVEEVEYLRVHTGLLSLFVYLKTGCSPHVFRDSNTETPEV